MNKEQALQEMFAAFGAALNPDRLRVYAARWANKLPSEVVSMVIDYAIRDEARLPTIQRLWALSTEKRDKIEREIEECWFCDSTGFIPGVWARDNRVYAGSIARCKCSNAKKGAPEINFELDSRYIPLAKEAKERGGGWSPWAVMSVVELRMLGEMHEEPEISTPSAAAREIAEKWTVSL